MLRGDNDRPFYECTTLASVQKRIIVSVINDLNTDQRVHKMCSFMQKQGYEVLLVGRRVKNSQPMEKRPYATKRMKLLFEKGPLFYAAFNFRLYFVLLFRRVDILVSNDLDTLLPNYIVSKLRRKKLIYDSHEYFTEVPELIHRPKIQRIWERIEGFTLPKVNYAITVNKSIAERYEEKYGVQFKVVRNVSPLYQPLFERSKKELGLPENMPLLIMQGAGLNMDRGVEEAIRAMEFVTLSKLIIVGDGDIIPQMKILVNELQLEDKVLFFGKRPYAELMQFTHHATLGLSFDQPTNPNYRFSLPNKVFDYIHTQTPVLCSDVIEVRGIVERYDLGMVVRDFEPHTLAKILDDAIGNSEQLEHWKKNCNIAAQTEHWDNEVQVLSEFYPKV